MIVKINSKKKPKFYGITYLKLCSHAQFIVTITEELSYIFCRRVYNRYPDTIRDRYLFTLYTRRHDAYPTDCRIVT